MLDATVAYLLNLLSLPEVSLPALFVITLVPGMLSVLHDLRQGFGPPR